MENKIINNNNESSNIIIAVVQNKALKLFNKWE